MAASAMDERKAIGHPVQKRAPRFHSVSLPNMISKHSNLAGLAVRRLYYTRVCRTPLKAPPPCTAFGTRGRGL